jgi:hypothetical protein
MLHKVAVNDFWNINTSITADSSVKYLLLLRGRFVFSSFFWSHWRTMSMESVSRCFGSICRAKVSKLCVALLSPHKITTE